MNITTKFTIGDKVYRLSSDTAETKIDCSVCNDTHEVDIKGTLFMCPNCAHGTSRWKTRWFVHTTPTTIGEIRLEVKLKAFHQRNYFDEDEIQGDEGSIKEQYMLAATGIGSGQLWGYQDLFLTVAEAQTEANKRNELILVEEAKIPQ